VGSILREEGHDVVGFYYNPNVQPYKEFEARLGAFREVCEAEGLDLVVDETYEPERWLRGALEAELRCEYCYRDRLETTARRAAEGGFDAFTSTLLASPYQRHDLARRLGEEIAESVGITFLYRDFREHWKESRHRTFEIGVYRQKYCGCILSERDRYLGEPDEGGGP
jgi:predicted adenine nucleotide alpha hydrolase (AANH) superfamily ATPase